MQKSLEIINKSLVQVLNNSLKNYLDEPQNKDYQGFTFNIGNYSFRHRQGKKTPVKQGYFVAFWKKDSQNKNQAYSIEESPDFQVVTIIDGENQGLFLFPKSVFVQQKILRTTYLKGKMAARFYPTWETELNKTAEKTQKWQQEYFIDLSKEKIDFQKLRRLL